MSVISLSISRHVSRCEGCSLRDSARPLLPLKIDWYPAWAGSYNKGPGVWLPTLFKIYKGKEVEIKICLLLQLYGNL